MCEQDPLNEVKLFTDTDCFGEWIQIDHSGSFPIDTKVQSLIVPENFQVQFIQNGYKNDFDKYIWGTTIEDTSVYFDKWKNNQDESHLSFDGINHVVVKKLGDRQNLLASSCVGLLEPPLLGYEPVKDGNLNLKCDQFLSNYCSGFDSYSREVCQHRKLCAITPNSNSFNNLNIFICILGLITIMAFICFLFSSKNTSPILIMNNEIH
jgi:hypothetical protein